jgi:hypothetical protein
MNTHWRSPSGSVCSRDNANDRSDVVSLLAAVCRAQFANAASFSQSNSIPGCLPAMWGNGVTEVAEVAATSIIYSFN